MEGKNTPILGFYIQPNFRMMVITVAGNICDFAGTDKIGLWDSKTMKNISLFQSTLSHENQIFMKALAGGQGNRVVIHNQDRFQILDFNKPENPIEWEKVVPSDDIVEIAVDKTNDKEIYVLMKSGSLNVWNIEEHKIIQTFNLIRKMYKRIQVFPGGQFFGLMDKYGYELNLLERATKIETKITLKSPAVKYLVLNSYEIAILFQNHVKIHSLKGEPQNIKAMLKLDDPDDKFLNLILLNEGKWLSVAGSKGVIRIWDLASEALLYKLDTNIQSNPDEQKEPQKIHVQLYLPTLNQLGILDSDERHFLTFNLGKFDSPPTEFQSEFKFLKIQNSSINNFENAFKLNEGKQVALLSTKGVFVGDEVLFSQVISIVDILSGAGLGSYELLLNDFSLVQGTVRSNGKDKVFYLMRNNQTQEKLFVEFDVQKFLSIPDDKRSNITLARQTCEKVYPFEVQQKGEYAIFNSHSSTIERIIVPYKQDLSALSDEFIKFKDTAGIAVYDYQIKQKKMIEFDLPQFTVKCAEMIDEDRLIFINQFNAVEVWNIAENEIESSENIEHPVTLLRCFADRLLLVDDKNIAHFYQYETFDQVCEFQLKEQQLKSIQSINEQACLVLYLDNSLQQLNLESHQTISLKQKATDFIQTSNNSESPQVLLLNEEYFQVIPFSSLH